ncbi:copper chaperone NosL [Mesobacillus persicus]|uniref:Copper chaperone NosL n=1 Tax=Mesobacillus persicus TaxID=930146 RepID=A0A1H7YZQ9_9BACI|nr:nitrous oxide reductase accessory protein NosL [Mesobacillus persicus]SEM50727.1 copper chaperone NosL [Mesobacillus persicus]
MKRNRFNLFGLAIIILLLAACGNDEVQPVDINEATDTCEVCNMQVANDQHATQIVLENGKSMVFDDVGCMYEWISNNSDEKKTAFVRDYHDKEWILVDEATFVYNPSVKTPMAYNMISFKDTASAESFAAENEGSTVMTANELADHSWERNQEMMEKHKMEDHSHSHSEEMDENHNEESENHSDSHEANHDDESHE